MGCSQSKLDEEEAVQICKDRKRFIRQAVEQRIKFASTHIAYIQSLKRISDALREYIEGDDDPHEFSLDSFITPVKKSIPHDFITITPPKLIQAKPGSRMKVNYLMASGSRAVSIEERPPRSPETSRVAAYMDGYFGMNMNMNSSSIFWNPMNSPENRPISHNLPPPSPQNSQWDFFWNPFSSLDYYGYNYDRSGIDHQSSVDDEIKGLRRVREEEGIPELEEDEPDEPEKRFTNHHNMKVKEESDKIDVDCCTDEVTVEDVDDVDDDDDDDEDDEEFTDSGYETGNDNDNDNGNCIGTQERRSVEVSRVETTGHIVGGDGDVAKSETPGYTVYVNRRPTNMAEVIKDLEDQFVTVCNAAKDVSGLLEASKAQYSSSTSELSAIKMLNPVALFRSGSSRSSSSRFLMSSSSGSKESGHESTSDRSDESCMLSGSHQSTLERLFAWEKKLYDEVRSGERVRIAYEKKCMLLRNQDVKGDDPSSVDKTRDAVRDLHTQIKISIHSIEAISKRIEALRDQELLPQLLELVHGLNRMWKVMADCHQIQKRTLDDAKLLLAGTPSKHHKKRNTASLPETNGHKLARSALNLEAQLRNWRACFEAWITSQRSYVQALAGWLLRCFRCDPNPEKVRLLPCPHPLYGICIQWSRLLNGLNEKPVLDGLDFFAAGMGSLYAQQLKEDQNRSGSRRYGSGSESMELVEVDKVDEVMTAEKLAEVAVRVLCAGMSVAVSSLTEFAIGSAEEYSKLVSQPEDGKLAHSSEQNEM